MQTERGNDAKHKYNKHSYVLTFTVLRIDHNVLIKGTTSMFVSF